MLTLTLTGLAADSRLAGALRVDVALPVLVAAVVIALAAASLRLDRTPPDTTSRQGPEHPTGPTGTN